ncbi:MAG: VanZ family protein, partial [Marinoscillum sp.]
MKINSIKKGRVVILLPSILFFTFICLIIFMADTDHDSWILKIPKIIPYGDKLGHFLLYGIMAFLLNTTLNYRRIKVLKVSFLLGALIVLGFAIAEEFTQLAFSSRT